MAVYGPEMPGFIMRELEIGFRAAAAEDSEACGFGALFDYACMLEEGHDIVHESGSSPYCGLCR